MCIRSRAYEIPAPRADDPSGIWRKIGPQRQAECEVKCEACCDCNGGRIHFPVPHAYALMSVCRTRQRIEGGL